MLLHDYLGQAAQRHPKKTALVAGKERWTYHALDEKVSAVARHLHTRGLGRGDRVAVYLENAAEQVAAIFGILRAGGCIVVVNPTTQVDRLGYILSHSGARFLFAPVVKDGLVMRAIEQGAEPAEVIWVGGLPSGGKGMSFDDFSSPLQSVTLPRVINEDLAAIIYTSGSTGKPKGVTHLHRTIDSAVESIIEYLENSEEDVILNVLPLSSSYGLLQLLVTVRTCARLVLEQGIGYPFEVIKKIREEKVTGMAGAPTVWAILLKLEDVKPSDVATLRYITNAAAALPASFVPRLQAAFPRTKLYLMHGLTECLRTTYLSPDQLDTRPTSVGTGMPNVELWVQDGNGNRLPPGVPGEMVVRGSNIMVGYWNDPEATARMIQPGRFPWERVLRTGDLFRADEEGYFYFVARGDELIKSRGEKVSPIEVEDVVYLMPEVLEARVIGVPDQVLGQAIRAEIVLKDGQQLSVQHVKAHCRKHLEDFKVPHQVLFVGSLPKTQGGKIKRSA
jgi:acyl-CoA synthetase (AMP-forming)/AMP-acid ligase II